MAEQQTLSAGGAIVARAATDYRLKRFLLVAVLMAYGIMCIRDGFYRYPQENDKARAEKLEVLPHPGFDVQLNQVLGVLLPPMSVFFLVWCLYASRGEIRFDGATLKMPGHPPIPANALRRIDRAKWDRKGIAFVEYQFPGIAKSGTVKLDDFVYQRKPIDAIFAEVERIVTGGSSPAEMAVVATPVDAPVVMNEPADAPVKPVMVIPPRPASMLPPSVTPPRPRQGPGGF